MDLVACLLCLLISSRSWQSSWASGVLYPHGTTEGDAVAPKNDDGSTGMIHITVEFPYFDSLHTSLYVDTNGAISFLREVSQYTPDAFPLGNNWRLITPFWADVDTRYNHGGVYYRQTTDASILSRANGDVRGAFLSQGRFEATWAFVCTWANVTYYRRNEDTAATSNTNTFQAVLVTDEIHSFVIFNYDVITWTTGSASGGSSGTGGTPAQAGFNAGDGKRYFSVPGSRTAAIIDVENTTNVGVPGRWVFQVDNAEVTAAGDCSSSSRGGLVVSPIQGLIYGGTEVFMSGPCFNETDDLVCKFGGQAVPGYYVSELRAKCFAPPLFNKQRVSFQLSTDAGKSFRYRAFFIPTYHYDVEYDVVRANRAAWDNGGPYVIRWEVEKLNTSLVDIDLLAISNDDNGQVELHWIPVTRGMANSGTARLGELIQVAPLAALSGAIRASSAGSAVEEKNTSPVLWSDLHTLEWYAHAYITAVLLGQTKNAEHTSFIDDVIPDLRDRLRSTPKNWESIISALKVYRKDIAGSVCRSWFAKDRDVPLPGDLPPCPCTLQQALRDRGRYGPDPTCYQGSSYAYNCELNPGAEHCVISSGCSQSGGATQCCYDGKGRLLNVADWEIGGGTLDRAHMTCSHPHQVPYVSHFVNDVAPQHFCCLWSESQDLCRSTYFRRRPSRDCKGYVPPRIVGAFGDLHMVTLDGTFYTFNRLGEYVIMQTKDKRFVIQGRTQQIPTSRAGIMTRATALTSLAVTSGDGHVIEVNTTARRPIDVLVDSKRVEYNDLALGFMTGVSFHTQNTTALGISLQQFGVYLEIQSAAGFLNLKLFLPATFKGETQGLVGTWNDDPDDDFMARSGTVVPSNATTRNIHVNFGETWRTEENTSIFTYYNGTSHADYQDLNFEPLYEIPFDFQSNETRQRATQVCGTIQQCLFDFLMTEREDVAIATREFVLGIEKAVNDTKPIVTCGYLATPLNGTKHFTGYFAGNEVTFRCNEGHTLAGSSVRRCLIGGEWDGHKTQCRASGTTRLSYGGFLLLVLSLVVTKDMVL
ncbi:protein mesh-like isoform X1 [Lingula anatina]|uniref:Protein mesh-like isoform X1 n=1 Tax=Lingula anatina TaxID=7574 RepID=A0A1S3JH85_LINAN|nr:protein mesh-like isoform X1 [Lingula anatina]|eukprot:XP_013409259.1 protein mesh-like isoform X1 [Lingula anatina]